MVFAMRPRIHNKLHLSNVFRPSGMLSSYASSAYYLMTHIHKTYLKRVPNYGAEIRKHIV